MQERLNSIRKDMPRPHTSQWQTQVLNAEFDESYRRNNKEIFNTLGNEYGWQFLGNVLRFHYLRDGNAITKTHMRAVSAVKPTQGCQVSVIAADARWSGRVLEIAR